ncbi:hypothetical protein F7725_019715 [Dissostichus mawsoni]|uniref:Uncharacterized protein n=1 Tax=Dissostichus mawsoni TaxID=36200 RepID=A0A7J5YKH8_DISMA|nr:hypothetical protein F7725_019715 [Dissostichus mawsoni]
MTCSQLEHVSRVDVVWDEYFPESLKAETRSKGGKGVHRHVERSSEADNRILLCLGDTVKEGYNKVSIRTVDTDVVVLAVTAAQSLNITELWTGGRVFVLDHKRWTGPMKQAVDNLLNKHHGQKDMLKLVDKDYAALVLDSCTDPNSMLHPTTKHHICQYVKHLSKLLNTSSSINISPEKLQERQVLWHSLTEGSETTSVSVVTMPVAVFNPTPLTLEHQQQQQQQQKKQTKRCLSCGQPKARFENDGSFIHHFYMQGTVRYFYCSTNVFITYGAEGLTDPKMPFGDFAETAFFPQELEAMKQRVEARVQQKRKNAEPEHKGRKCGF